MNPDQQLISPIAAFIAARLQYPMPPCNSRHGPRVSTISVDQHKDKFNYVRIYCTLADPEEIKFAWTEHGNEGESIEEFKALCLKRDMRHYRRCYMDMVAIVPHLRDRICSSADYGNLLYETYAELEAHIDEVASKEKHPNAQMSDMDSMVRRYNAHSVEELKMMFRSVYGEPSIHDLQLQDT